MMWLRSTNPSPYTIKSLRLNLTRITIHDRRRSNKTQSQLTANTFVTIHHAHHVVRLSQSIIVHILDIHSLCYIYSIITHITSSFSWYKCCIIRTNEPDLHSCWIQNIMNDATHLIKLTTCNLAINTQNYLNFRI